MTHDENARNDYKTMWDLIHENNKLREQLNYVIRELHGVCRSTNRSMSMVSYNLYLSSLYKEKGNK